MEEENYCKNLLNCLSFHQKNIRFCTTLNIGNIISCYDEKNPKEIAEKIYNIRKIVRENIYNNIMPENCVDCIYKIKEKTNTDKIKRIDLFYWYHCNCRCFYCSYRDITKGEFSDKEKEGNPFVYKTIEELYKHNEIDKKELIVAFGGGEIGVLKEFPKLIDLFLKNNVKEIYFESSGIRYLKSVEKCLKQGKGVIVVAVCAGSRETYKKIKNRDKYDQVMKNLKKYVQVAKTCKTREWNHHKIVSKYIILHGFNDNEEEINKWLIESKKIGITNIEISMEFCWGIQTKAGQKVEDYNYKLFEYTEKRCKELNLNIVKFHLSCFNGKRCVLENYL